jgi:hypothetical protein
MPAADWEPLATRHGFILSALREVRAKAKDHVGATGPDALLEPSEKRNRDAVYKPLIERRLVEDCSRYMGTPGKFFIRITNFGIACLLWGMVPKGAIDGDVGAAAWLVDGEFTFAAKSGTESK